MMIQRITIRNFGSIDFFEQEFAEGINVVNSRYPDDVSRAIRLILNHKEAPLPAPRVRGDASVTALVRMDETEFHVTVGLNSHPKKLYLSADNAHGKDVTDEYLYLTSHCPEHDLSDVFQGNAKGSSFKLLQYWDEDRYYRPTELARRTDRMSETKTFRTHLKAFIKDLKFGQIHAIAFDRSDQMLFRYLYFLKTAEFWCSFEELRNLHSVKKPLLIEKIRRPSDCPTVFNALLKTTAHPNRQLIIL